MVEDTNKGEEPVGGPEGEPFTPPKKVGGNGKWFAIIGVLIVIIAALAVIDATHPPAKTKTVTVPFVPTPSSLTGPSNIFAGNYYSFNLTANGQFNNATVYWGDGTSTVYSYSTVGNTIFTAKHFYATPGADVIWYKVNYSTGNGYGNATMVPVTVGFPVSSSSNTVFGYIAVTNSSAKAQVAGSNLFAPGTTLHMMVSALGEPSNQSNQVIQQVVTLYNNGKAVKTVYYNYTWFPNAAKFYYKSPSSKEYFNVTNLPAGYNVVNVTTVIGQNLNKATGKTTGTLETYYTMTVPSFKNGNLITSKKVTSKTTFTNAEIAPGGYSRLDPQIAYDTVSNEILMNTLQFLIQYKGNSTTQFFPELAAYLPSPGHGINTNYKNYTETYVNNNGTTVSYTVHLKPYENYTFQIRANASWQDGTPVTAYDVYVAFVRDLLFVAGPTGTPGWIQAQYLLPGNYYATNTYYNITNNITYSNATNTITFHFQLPMNPTLVWQIFAASGAYIGQAKYYVKQGEHLIFNSAGFKNYEKYADPANIPSTIVNGLVADGPYMINYVIPGEEVVLKANPYFKPVKYYPAPSIPNVVIKYVSSYSQSYLLLKSGQAQSGGIPSSDWSLALHLEKLGLITTLTFPTLSVFWYNFNFNINTSATSSIDPSANLPSALFDSWHARAAFAYAYNYKYYIDYQIGNALYGVNFGTLYAGMIPAGMAFYQNMSVLNQTTIGVPYYNMNAAKHFWEVFMNKDGAKLGLSWANTTAGPQVNYNGKQLTVPIAIYAGDPVDLDGATTWASSLAKLGIKADVIPINFNILLTFFVPPNPAPIWILGWAPDYPYPSDYLQPMALPTDGLYPAANYFDTLWMNNTTSNPLANQSAANALQNMTNYYNTAFSATNVATASQYYQMMNHELINMTAYVYLFQSNAIEIFSTQLNPTPNPIWQTNVMFGGGGDFFYNYFQYK